MGDAEHQTLLKLVFLIPCTSSSRLCVGLDPRTLLLERNQRKRRQPNRLYTQDKRLNQQRMAPAKVGPDVLAEASHGSTWC